MKKLDKLILGSFIGPFLLTFVVVDFILLIVNMLKYFDEIFGKGLSFWIYAELIGYFVISISPMALPLAVLLSSLMTFGNLGEHFELTAIKSSGISLIRALRPIAIFTVFLVIAAFLSNNFLVPRVNLKTFSLLYDIRMKSPALDIREGIFYAGIPGYSIKVNQKLNDNDLKDIIIYNHNDALGNLDVTVADSGRMEKFFNENYMKLTLYKGTNYKEARATRGIAEKPVEFNRTTFDENIIVFSLDEFQLSRTPEDLWSTNRSIKNISEIKLGLDSIAFLVNDQQFKNYKTAESIFPFFTRSREIEPLDPIVEKKARYDSLRAELSRRERRRRDSLSQVLNAEKDTVIVNVEESLITIPDSSKRLYVSSSTSAKPNVDSIIQEKEARSRAIQRDLEEEMVDNPVPDDPNDLKVKVKRTTPLTAEEKAFIDSLVHKRGYRTNAMTMALNNSRNLKNNFQVTKVQIENHEREFRRFEIAWYQKYTQAFACFVMFLIGAPLGAIIKKGGLGLPVLVSIIFFIVYYMLTITGEKWAKEGVTDPFWGTWFSCLVLLPFGFFFLKQARKDARLFEPDFYLEWWKGVRKRVKGNNAKAA
ncbi:lipopolysaccharide export system permease protein [Algoriphagus faecimaris]|uniref:Lipopolysaccharide export system permease protein n=1 Tax=Algoriphagus faecimaris TaxID=686796 RepID=A0A1G6PN18_9BACT|nr:LptF/LptG family permease [Algoriphagus faecimaris]SDC81458.1 lipopolysaccharide export system permease protein [Algoriphagus faecimaris]